MKNKISQIPQRMMTFICLSLFAFTTLNIQPANADFNNLKYNIFINSEQMFLSGFLNHEFFSKVEILNKFKGCIYNGSNTQNNLLKYLSTAPVLMTAWLSITASFIFFINFIYPDALTFPVI